MVTVAVTGVAGTLGGRVLRALAARDDVDRIVGLDLVAPWPSPSTKLVFRQVDLRDPGLTSALAGVDVLVGLVAYRGPIHDVHTWHSVEVEGARNLFRAARDAGVGHVVHVSSAFAYGARPDNDLPLTESSPLRGTPGLPVSEHAREVERWLEGWRDEADGPQVAVLRFAPVIGPQVDNVITRLLESPRLVTIRAHRPPLQFLHLDDAVGAIVHAIEQRLTGPYNVCPEGWLSFDEVTAIAGKRTIDVPEEVAFSVAEQLWRLRVGEHPPGMLHHLMHPWVMSADALVATGWQARASNRDALADTVREHAAYLALGGVRARRRTIGGVLVGMAATALGLLGLAVRARRRRRRAHHDPSGSA